MIQQIANEDAFPAPQRVDWSFDVGSQTPLGTGRFVNNRPGLFRANGAPLIVNPDDKTARFARCGSQELFLNLAAEDPVITALDTGPSSSAPGAPLRLLFQAPVQAVGAYLGLATDTSTPAGATLHAMMWVQLDRATSWELVTADGPRGAPLAPGSRPTAPFVAAQTNDVGIRMVAFDASSVAPFKRIVIGNLFWS